MVRMTIPLILRKHWPWLAAAASGGLLTVCFAPWNLPVLVWFALLPLIAALWWREEEAEAHAVWMAPALGYLSGFIFFASTFQWLSALADLFENPVLNGLSVYLAAYLAVYPALWAWFVARPPRRGNSAMATSFYNVAFALQGASAWVVLEWVRGWLFTGFGWNSPGVALHNDLALIQIVDLVGVHGVTFVVVFCNLILALAFRRIRQEASIRALPNLRGEFMTLLVMLGLCVSYGIRCVLKKPVSPSFSLRTVAVQPNIPQDEKFDPSDEDAALKKLDRLMQLLEGLQPPPDLVLWPEAATPRGMFADAESFQFTRRQVERSGAPLLLGSLEPATSEPDGTGAVFEYNSAVLLEGNNTPPQSYRKRHLVPFGEFLPFRDWLPNWVRVLVPGDLRAGDEANLLFLKKPSVRIGALICFEDSLAQEARSLVKEGAQLLVNLTNDSWFSTSAAAAQHLANAKFRAVEMRLPLLRCANTGVTCSVDSLGRVEQRLASFTEGIDTLVVRIPKNPEFTWYAKHGDSWLWLCVAGVLMGVSRRLRRAG
jgi:apolipoprotein N-acyltransferase